MDSTVRALVLGGSGFVGRHVCAAFAAAGAEVIAVSRTITELPGTRTIRLDLAEIGRQCVLIDPRLEDVCRRADDLTVFAWLFRYPGDEEEPSLCRVMSWVPGRRLWFSMKAKHFAQLGELIAQLHEHVGRFRPPRGFVRPRA